jgi:imidazolonepropionase-like amidohydrolase
VGSGRSGGSFVKTVGLKALAGRVGAAGVGVAARARNRHDPPRVVFPHPEPTRIDDVTIVDPRDGSKTPGMSILMRNGSISAVAPVGTVAIDEGVRVVDGAGRYAVPGYNNMHTHVLQAERPALMMVTMLAEGVTGMRQMMGTCELLRYREENRLPLTPHAPQLLSMPGDLLLPFNCGSVIEVVEEISRQQDQGADFIKLILVGRKVFFAAVKAAHERGMKIAGHLPPSVGIAEASAVGFDSIEHLGTGANVWIACSSDAGLSGKRDLRSPVLSLVAHLPFAYRIFTKVMQKRLINPAAYAEPGDLMTLQQALDTYDYNKARALARSLAANRTWQTPTLVRLRTQYLADAPEYQDDPWLAMMSKRNRCEYLKVLARFGRLPDEVRATYRKAYALSLTMVGLWHQHGVPMMTGTDGQGRVPGQSLQLEFQEMCRAGLAPIDILRATTIAPAHYLDRIDRMGLIAAGMDANFLLLDSDPLAAVQNLAAISVMVRAGHTFTTDELAAIRERLATADVEHPHTRLAAAGRQNSCCGA